MRRLLLLWGLVIGLVSCGAPGKESVDSLPEEEVATTSVPEAPAAPPRITPKDYAGIGLGTNLYQYESRLRAGARQTGEGNFGIYYIDGDEASAPAYLEPQPSAEGQSIFSITVTKPGPQTQEGIGVGSNYAELQAAYPGIEAHGSEVESRVYASGGGYVFRLDAYAATYELPDGLVGDETRVLEVVLGR